MQGKEIGLPAIRLIAVAEGNGEWDAQETADLRWVRVEEFLQARSLARNTQTAYRRELKRFLAWTDRGWGSITPRQITQFKAYLKTQSLAPNSVNRALTALMSFFAWFRVAYPELRVDDPTMAVELEQVTLPEAQDLTDFEVAALYLAVEERGETQGRDLALLEVLSHGLRSQEVVNLNVEDYDGRRLRIRVAKGDSTGTVPLSAQARERLNAYLSERRRQQGILLLESPLFVSTGRNRRGQRLGYQGLYYVVKSLGQRAARRAQFAIERRRQSVMGSQETELDDPWMQFSDLELEKIQGLGDVHPHQLRHTFATGLLLRGMESLHARTLTRHRSEGSFKRYAKRALSAAAERAFYQSIGEEIP